MIYQIEFHWQNNFYAVQVLDEDNYDSQLIKIAPTTTFTATPLLKINTPIKDLRANLQFISWFTQTPQATTSFIFNPLKQQIENQIVWDLNIMGRDSRLTNIRFKEK